ncbi:TIR domain-containing protein [Frankia sp. ArI3]|uniref:TIR domain-containing protein n=2 Tax=unclassified Frankia TaxID=2632575 RepID=UPI001C6FCEA7|nr:TIR domain-containing protein [Frankia sp. ArI3]
MFVSYTAADEPWATWVATVLESAGLTARIQVWDSPPGTNFVEWMNNQLAGARWTVALYSEAYFASKWCTAEWTASLARQTLLPIRLEPVEPPAVLQMVTWVDLFDIDESRAKEKILYAVGAQVMPRLAKFPGKATDQAWPPSTTDAIITNGSTNFYSAVSEPDLTDAIKLLGSDMRPVRLGAIRLLARIADTYPDEQEAIIGILSSFVCEQTETIRSQHKIGHTEMEIGVDVQAALTALGQFPDQPGVSRADLRNSYIFGANLCRLNFSHADLSGADLTHTQLHNTDLTATRFAGANLSKAIDLDDDQISAASGDYKTQLPKHVTRPGFWPPYQPNFPF